MEGLYGQAVAFDGQNDSQGSVHADDDLDLFDPGWGGLTVTVWVKAGDGSSSDAYEFVVSKGNRTSGNAGWSIWTENQSLLVRSNASNTSEQRASQHITEWPLEEWMHVAMVIDREADQICGYLNGSHEGWIPGGGGPASDGLSEVRLFYIPMAARDPEPADAQTVVDVDVLLRWRAGREADSHLVYLGTDPENLDLVETTSESHYTADTLNYATTYYWSVTEVNEAEAVPAYSGDVWSFRTPDYFTVDDFEQYNDTCRRIFFAWEDGLGHNGAEGIGGCDVPPYDGNGGGSIVGNNQAPFAERTIVNAGGSTQSLPSSYKNVLGPSEATLGIDEQDWTAGGIKTLSLAFYGASDNTGQLYIKINNTKVVYDGDIAQEQWQKWTIDLTALSGLQNVTALTIGMDGASASGLLYIDDIRLYPISWH